MRKIILFSFFSFFGFCSFSQGTTDNVQLAFHSGSAKELVKYFNKITEVKINNVGSDYSITQAEPVFRDFFKQNPPTTFEYIHKGQSPQGLKYNIAQYVSNNKSYRVVMLLKKNGQNYYVDTINLSEE
ncbi:DUF4783 domain-containing protein [Reichenbachiella versicolor]|uniref:DUF4783 domain-containing protein n=1 Tax=Reichenbachiella versicolor TaxID=1821036 RepID=UPI000D6E7B8D|nr:DUF4783 domain-containing protein [Reichenbachiella versicolor]